MKLVLQNIKELVQVENKARQWVAGAEMAKLATIKDAYLIIKDEWIEDFGEMKNLNPDAFDDDDLIMEIDCRGKMVFPCYCDSHTHLVFPASRETEFVDKIKGLSYEEIARRGGGILNSALRMESISEDELFEQSMARINEIISTGTGAVEIKSGYGLSTASELKMLRVTERLKMNTPVKIVSTFLGAHAIPAEYREKRGQYIDLLINEMIPVVASEQLADYIDVFCDKGFFTVEETEQILMAGMKYGLRPKLHANELALSGGVQAGVKYNALSVDHLEFMGDAEIAALQGTETMPTVLPGAAFFLNLKLSPVRKMIDAGLPVALASDYNPGSSPSGNMNFVQSLGCIRYQMLPEEALNATTINTAYAMGISDTHGSIARGKQANVFITKEIPSYAFIPYSFGFNPVETVILNGEII
ncbi:MAG: imidazolonepropionase [Bacteroidetes bacterium GWF2_42_66]|nr:MAG: imidazolonepropionase [Bacteroidetes bacterium GWA2_42_15]OFX97554.1 MAG: imidazolonepropionase [Bacteroidetes bacterium GWE2_42_39]OFY43751.1 MAG: imidazolonepropionase [Bacteroidetes bacterium GWF2_42_66]HBL76273.1 imidazolonepropionase [Prolixibacteraceae bacterium]HCU60511.1 imidazolonepropionase [Prolixibacteraceae bacterium]